MRLRVRAFPLGIAPRLAAMALAVVGCSAALPTVSSTPTRSDSPPAASQPLPSSLTPGASGQGSIPWTSGERDILAGIRADARVRCLPIRADLPLGALAGVECSPDSDLVARVGFYRFRTERDMFAAHFARFDQYGVARDSQPKADQIGNDRDCWRGVPVEGSYFPGGAEGIPNRIGCFIDEYGIANTRVLWVRHLISIGALGKNADIAKLHAWVWGDNTDPRGGPSLWLSPA